MPANDLISRGARTTPFGLLAVHMTAAAERVIASGRRSAFADEIPADLSPSVVGYRVFDGTAATHVSGDGYHRVHE